MPKDVLITPSEALIQFSSSAGTGSGQILADNNNNLVISNLVGDVLLGDGASDVFIGDGTNNVDIVFEQNGEIRDDGSGKSLTIGSKTTNVFVTGSSTIAMQKDGGKVGIGKSTATKELEVKGSISASGDLFANGNLRISGAIKLPQTSDIILGPMSTFPTTNTTAIQWDFPSDDTFIYAQQSSSDVTFLVFEQRDNTTSDANVFWFNDYRGPNKDSFPLFMDGSKLVVNYIYDKRAVFARDGSAVNGKSNNVDFYLLKSGSSSVSAANSLIFGDVSDLQVRINGDITASGNISLADDKEIKLGNSNDLRIFHDPNNGVIREDGGGDLFIQGSAIRIRENSDGGTIALFTDGAGTELRHDNVKKFETSDGGINVTGHITASGNISASGTIESTGNITTGGELSANTIVVGSTISHIGDTNTLISFGTDTLTFKAGNEAFITITEDGSQDNIVIGDGGDIDFH